MALTLDLTDKLVRFPLAYSWQPVRGWSVKHFDTTSTNTTRRTKQNALGEGPWDACEKLWVDTGTIAKEIISSDFVFHPGLGNDVPDVNFPADPPHPWTAYISAKCPPGLSEGQTEALFGIYRTLRTGDYNGAGQQLNSVGNVVNPSDPRDEFFFKPNPANVAADQLLRWGNKPKSTINWPAWVDWRDFNDELIKWDNSLYTPRSLSLTPTFGGSLIPGQTYHVRVSTLKGGEESSASLMTLETKANPITLSAGQTAFQVNWLIKGDEKTPTENPLGITGYKIYIGTTPTTWLGYFLVTNPSLRTFLVSTTLALSSGQPLDLASNGLLTNIKRFECGLFFTPPYDFTVALDRICQISCADWQWSGLGTNTYRNDKIRFLSPATRDPVFTLNLAETSAGTFKTWPVDRRSRPNQIIVNFRDRDDEFLGEAQPVILNREQLQTDDKYVRAHTIEGGTMTRSQAQRVASFFAKVLCDMDQMAGMIASPKSYHVLPGDVIYVTNDTPDWVDIKFVARKKGENVDKKTLGDSIIAQLYSDDLYSDTNYSPLPNPLPRPKFDPLEPPPLVSNVTLSETLSTSKDGSIIGNLQGIVQFTNHHSPQIGRVWLKKPQDSDYQPTGIILTPNSVNNQDTFMIVGIGAGLQRVKVVSESLLGARKGTGNGLDVAIEYSLTTVGKVTPPGPVTNFVLSFDGNYIVGAFTPPVDTDVNYYEIHLVSGAVETLLVEGLQTKFLFVPPKGWNGALSFKIYVVNRSRLRSTGNQQSISPTLPGPGSLSNTQLIGKHSAGGDFIQTIQSTYTFPTYTFGPMRARVYLTPPGSSEIDLGITLIPDINGNNRTFWVLAQGKGSHTIRVISELAPTSSPSPSSASVLVEVTNQAFVLGDITGIFHVIPQVGGTPSLVRWNTPADYEKVSYFEVYKDLIGGTVVPGGSDWTDHWNGGAGGTLLYRGRENSFSFRLGDLNSVGEFFVRSVDSMGNVSRFYGPASFDDFTAGPLTAPTVFVDTTTSNSKIIVLHISTEIGVYEGITYTRVQIRQQGGAWPSTAANTNGQFQFEGPCREVIIPWAIEGQTVELRVMFDGQPSSDWSNTVSFTLPSS